MPAFEVMDVLAAARRRDEEVVQDPSLEVTCHLEVGQPAAPTPRAVLAAAADALRGPLGYTEASGLAELRSRIAGFHQRRSEQHELPIRNAVYPSAGSPKRSPQVHEGQVVVTSGASAGCVLALAAIADPGETVVTFEPGYPCYSNIAHTLGLATLGVHLDSSSGYRPNPGLLDDAVDAYGTASRIAAVVVASPANPTGTVLDACALESLAGWCHQHGAHLVVDEIYHGTAEGHLASAAGHNDAVVLQSFSKYFCMTGWRLGWLVLPPHLVRPVERLAQNLYLAPHTLSQYAALAAFDATDELDALAHLYATNRRILIDSLRSAGVTDIAPADGAFYVWADLGPWGDSAELSRSWLAELGVAVTPGGDFDSVAGNRFLRFSVAGSTETVTDAAGRLSTWLAAHQPTNPLQ